MSGLPSPDGTYASIQAVVGWVTLSGTLLSALALGANRPFAWILLGAVVCIMFGAQVLLTILRPVPVALGRAVPLMIGYMLVLVWAWVQIALPVSPALAHPSWGSLPGEDVWGRIGADPGQGRHFLLRLSVYGMIAWIMATSALSSRRAWSYVKVIAIFSTGLAVFGLYTALSGFNPILGIDTGRPGVVSASFVNRNSYATYAAFGLFANVAVYLHVAGRNAEDDGPSALRNFLENFFGGAWIYAMGVLLCGAAIALTASRAGAAATILGLVVLSVALSSGKGHRSRLLWGVLLAIVVFILFALSSDVLSRMLSARGEEGRFVIFPAILAVILERPWLGHGLGAFQDTFRAHVPLDVSSLDWVRAHSSYLENIYELGLPAAVLLYAVLVGVLTLIIRGLSHRKQDQELPALALACFGTAALHAAFDFSLQMPAVAGIFAAILGIGWTQSFRRNDRAATSPEQRGKRA